MNGRKSCRHRHERYTSLSLSNTCILPMSIFMISIDLNQKLFKLIAHLSVASFSRAIFQDSKIPCQGQKMASIKFCRSCRHERHS